MCALDGLRLRVFLCVTASRMAAVEILTIRSVCDHTYPSKINYEDDCVMEDIRLRLRGIAFAWVSRCATSLRVEKQCWTKHVEDTGYTLVRYPTVITLPCYSLENLGAVQGVTTSYFEALRVLEHGDLLHSETSNSRRNITSADPF